MKFESEFFWQAQRGLNFIISQDDIDKIRNLKSSKATNSGYCPDGIMLQWTAENNNLSIEELGRLFIAMQFIVMTAELTPEFKQKYNVKNYHESLLRRLYLEIDDYETRAITTGFKRPFGNSHVIGDVADELIRYGVDAKDADGKYNEGLCDIVYLEFINILDSFIKEFKINHRHFKCIGKSTLFSSKKFTKSKYEEVFCWAKYLTPDNFTGRLHSYMNEWILDESELRNDKIEEIIYK